LDYWEYIYFFTFTLKWGTPKMAIFNSRIKNKETNLDIPHISIIYCICLEDVIERTLPTHMFFVGKKHVMEMSMKYPWLYLVLQLKFHTALVVVRQIGLMNIMLNSKCKPPCFSLIPWPFLQHLKNLMHSKSNLYLLSLHVNIACTSIAISMLELVYFPSNEKSLKKQVPHTLLDSWAVNFSYLRQVATLGFVDNQGCPCAHNVLQPVAFYAPNVSNFCPQLQSIFAISALYSPFCQDLRIMRD